MENANLDSSFKEPGQGWERVRLLERGTALKNFFFFKDRRRLTKFLA